MTPQEFFQKNDGKPINFDKKFGNQCMDVYREYCDALGIPQSPPVKGAKDVWNTYLSEYFERVPYTQGLVPSIGWVGLWGSGVGEFGHIDIVARDITKTSFVGFDQNWPVLVDADGNGLGVAHYEAHNYNSMLGFLKPKNLPSTPGNGTVPPMDQFETNGLDKLRDYRKVRTINGVLAPEGNFEGFANALIASDKAKPGLESAKNSLETQLKNLNVILETKDNAISSMKEQIKTLQEQLQQVPPPTPGTVPTFTNPVAAFFYKLALFAQG